MTRLFQPLLFVALVSCARPPNAVIDTPPTQATPSPDDISECRGCDDGSEFECHDGIDNDQDGLEDCWDSDCDSDDWCANGKPVSNIAFHGVIQFEATDGSSCSDAVDGNADEVDAPLCEDCHELWCAQPADSDCLGVPERICFGIAYTSAETWDIWWHADDAFQSAGTASLNDDGWTRDVEACIPHADGTVCMELTLEPDP